MPRSLSFSAACHIAQVTTGSASTATTRYAIKRQVPAGRAARGARAAGVDTEVDGIALDARRRSRRAVNEARARARRIMGGDRTLRERTRDRSVLEAAGGPAVE